MFLSILDLRYLGKEHIMQNNRIEKRRTFFPSLRPKDCQNQAFLDRIKNTVLILAGSVVYGIGTQCFISYAQIAPGGASGIALMVNFVTGIPIGILTFLINIPLLVLAWFYLSKSFTVKTALACAVSSGIMDFVIAPLFPIYQGDRLLSSLFGGVLVGTGMALIFLAGCTTGGSDIIGYLLQKKKPHLSIGHALLIIDGFLLAASIFVFRNIESGLFGLISLFVQTQVIDRIIYGADVGNMVTIITSSPEEISRQIITTLERSATVLPGYGAYSKCSTDVLLCAVRKNQFSTLKQIIHRVDPAAFVLVTETSEVYGEGFKTIS